MLPVRSSGHLLGARPGFWVGTPPHSQGTARYLLDPSAATGTSARNKLAARTEILADVAAARAVG